MADIQTVLTRCEGEAVLLDFEGITISVVPIKILGRLVRLEFTGDSRVKVHKREVSEAIQWEMAELGGEAGGA